MKFDEAIIKCKPHMYYVYKQYSIDGYDSDDLYHETILWLMRDWNTIITLKECETKTAIINRAWWVCNHLNYYRPRIELVPFDEEKFIQLENILTEHDIMHILMKGRAKLSPKAFNVFRAKISTTDEMKLNMSRETPSRRDIKNFLGFSGRPYRKFMKEIKEFLKNEGICPNKR